jgi:hypothetical protein
VIFSLPLLELRLYVIQCLQCFCPDTYLDGSECQWSNPLSGFASQGSGERPDLDGIPQGCSGPVDGGVPHPCRAHPCLGKTGGDEGLLGRPVGGRQRGGAAVLIDGGGGDDSL